MERRTFPLIRCTLLLHYKYGGFPCHSFSLYQKEVYKRERFHFFLVSELSVSRILFMRTCLSLRNKEHWFVDSISFPHIQISSRQSLKLCFNLWPPKWLKPMRSLVRRFKPCRLYMLKALLRPGGINFKIFCLKTLMEGALRWE